MTQTLEFDTRYRVVRALLAHSSDFIEPSFNSSTADVRKAGESIIDLIVDLIRYAESEGIEDGGELLEAVEKALVA